MSEEEKVFQLYIQYEEERSGGEICAGDEDSNWPSHEDEEIYVTFKKCYRNRPKDSWYCDPFKVTEEVYNADEVYAAIIRYFDGGTFGRTCGYWHVVGIYLTYAEAQAAILNAQTGNGYKPWAGYFSGYERDQIEWFIVAD